jgi:tRNA threonylcarbamoyl adenosine modification protein YeaZ
VILLIDTSSSIAALATIDEKTGRTDDLLLSARSSELMPRLRELAADRHIGKVAVVTGPGSFTGLRVGVSFGVGLAMGRKIPIVPMPTLRLQAARSDRPLTAVVEAGRGRFYYQLHGHDPDLGGPADIPTTQPLVGRVSEAGARLLTAAGHVIEPDEGLHTVGEAAKLLLESAREVAYSSVQIEYMQSFTARL